MLRNSCKCGIGATVHPPTVLTVGVVIPVTPMAPHLLHHLKTPGTHSERERSISWSLLAGQPATLSGFSCHSNMGLGMEQNTQSTIPYGNFQLFSFSFFPIMLFLTIRVLMAVGVKYTMTSVSPPVLGWGHFPPSAFSTEHEIVLEMGLRDGGKLAVHEEDLQGIPACEAEIGKGAVVITDCGIDVVHINQNC